MIWYSLWEWHQASGVALYSRRRYALLRAYLEPNPLPYQRTDSKRRQHLKFRRQHEATTTDTYVDTVL